MEILHRANKLVEGGAVTGPSPDLTWTAIFGSPNPIGPGAARMSTPLSGPGGLRYVKYPWAFSSASTRTAIPCPLKRLIISSAMRSIASVSKSSSPSMLSSSGVELRFAAVG